MFIPRTVRVSDQSGGVPDQKDRAVFGGGEGAIFTPREECNSPVSR